MLHSKISIPGDILCLRINLPLRDVWALVCSLVDIGYISFNSKNAQQIQHTDKCVTMQLSP